MPEPKTLYLDQIAMSAEAGNLEYETNLKASLARAMEPTPIKHRHDPEAEAMIEKAVGKGNTVSAENLLEADMRGDLKLDYESRGVLIRCMQIAHSGASVRPGR